MAPADNTRSAKKSTRRRWRCDFCIHKYYDTYDEALEHERNCEARTVKVCLSYEDGKKLGLHLFDVSVHDNDSRSVESNVYVTVSGRSKVLTLLPAQKAANEIFSLASNFWRGLYALGDDAVNVSDDDDIHANGESGEESGDEGESADDGSTGNHHEEDENVLSDDLQDLILFAKNNMEYVVEGAGPCDYFDINSAILEVVSSGRLKEGDFITKVEYSGTRSRTKTLSLENRPGGALDFSNLLSEERNYPMDITILRRLHSQTDKASYAANYTEQTPIPIEKIRKLDLNNNGLIDNSYWDHFLYGAKKMHMLRELHLDRNNISKTGCKALAVLLKSNDMKLVNLSLRQNEIDDECISILAEALVGNRSLTYLDLDKNDRITVTGWSCISTLLCNKTDIQSTYLSNHTLKKLGGSLSSMSVIEPSSSPPALYHVYREIVDLLCLNFCMLPHDVGRRKIWMTHIGSISEPFQLQPFIDMDVKLMPRLLAYFTTSKYKKEEEELLRLVKLFHFIRNWDIPFLFGFPSAESVRIRRQISKSEGMNAERVTQLEALVAKLKLENKDLRDQVEELMEKNVCSSIWRSKRSRKS